MAKIWVHPDFKKLLKKRAIDEDMSLLALTEELSKKRGRVSQKDGFEFWI